MNHVSAYGAEPTVLLLLLLFLPRRGIMLVAVLACQLVQVIRRHLRTKGIIDRWSTLRETPMAAGLTDHRSTMKELLSYNFIKKQKTKIAHSWTL